MNTWRCRGSGVPGESMEALCPFPRPCPVHLFHQAVPELQTFIINQCKQNVSKFYEPR